jgi:hypothetical protein
MSADDEQIPLSAQQLASLHPHAALEPQYDARALLHWQ